MKGIRHVRGRLVPDRDGMPVVEINHDDLVRAAWELTMEKFFPALKPEPWWRQRWRQLRGVIIRWIDTH